MKIEEVYDRFEVPPNLRIHMRRVAGVIECLRRFWCGEKIDWELIVKAALVHDLGNIVRFTSFLGLRGGVEYWQKVQGRIVARYGIDDHAVTRQMLVELGMAARIVNLVGQKSFGNSVAVKKSRDWGLKVLCYADLRVLPTGVGSLAERIREVKARVPKYANRSDFDELVRACLEVEEQIQAKLTIGVEKINDQWGENKGNYLETLEI